MCLEYSLEVKATTSRVFSFGLNSMAAPDEPIKLESEDIIR